MREVSATEISRMRDLIEPLFDERCTILRRAITVDTSGGTSNTWTQVGALETVCRVDPTLWRRPTVFNIGDSVGNVDPIIITFRYDTDILAGDRVQIKSTGKSYDVLGRINEPTWNISLQVAAIPTVGA